MLRNRFVLSTCIGFLLVASPYPARARAAVEQPVVVHVVDSGGSALAGATVSLTAAAGGAFGVDGTTDAEGRFATTLPDGKAVYRVRVQKEGLAPIDHSVDLATQHGGRNRSLTIEVSMQPLSAADWFNRGVAAIRQGTLDEAAADFGRAVALDPTLERGWSVSAMVAAEQKRWDAALADADHAVALSPDDAQALRARYDALVALGRGADADAALDRLVVASHDPDVARIAFNAGAAAANRGDADTARRRFGQAIAVEPGLWQAHSALAELAARDKRYDDAVAELDRALETSPGNVALLGRKVEILRATGDAARLAAAEQELAKAKAANGS